MLRPALRNFNAILSRVTKSHLRNACIERAAARARTGAEMDFESIV
jgi:hypothetical protein